MAAWTSDELEKIGAADELELASLRSDGTQRKPVRIWVVRQGDDLYIRSVNGRTSAWFRGTQDRQEGRIWAGGVEQDVIFADADAEDINAAIDTAYRTKYRRYAANIVNTEFTPQARAATLRVIPR